MNNKNVANVKWFRDTPSVPFKGLSIGFQHWPKYIVKRNIMSSFVKINLPMFHVTDKAVEDKRAKPTLKMNLKLMLFSGCIGFRTLFADKSASLICVAN